MLFDSDLNWFFENPSTYWDDESEDEKQETVFHVAKNLLEVAQSNGWNSDALDLQNFAQEHQDVIWDFFLKHIDEYKEDFFNWEALCPAEIARRYVFQLAQNYESELLTVAKVGEILKCNS